MKKIVITSVYLLTILILSGCVTINPTGKLVSALGNPTIKMTDKAKEETKQEAKKKAEELSEEKKKEAAETKVLKQKNKENICGFSDKNVLSPPIKRLLENSMIQDFSRNLSAFRALAQEPLPLELAPYLEKSRFEELIPKLISPENKLDLNKSEFWLTIRQPAGFMGAGGFLAAINQLSHDLLESHATSGHEFEEMLRFYLLNYIDGKFVLRNGTQLAKPSGSITHERIQTDKGEKGIVSASLDKNTVTGLTTVILEAIFDYCLETPAYSYKDGKSIYEPDYMEIAGQSGKFNLVYLKKDPIDDYLFDDDIIPTATKFDEKLRKHFKEDCEEGKKCKMTEEDIKRIRRVSDFSAETTTAVVGAAFKSLGGAGLSAFGFFKFSFGDNDSISQIVEAATSVATRRKTEHLLYELIENGESYNCGIEEAANCSKKVQDLLKKFDYHEILKNRKSKENLL